METIITDHIQSQLDDLGESVVLAADDDLVMIGFDSIGFVRLIAFIHERFGIQVPHADVTVERFGSVAQIAAYLNAQGLTLDAETEGA